MGDFMDEAATRPAGKAMTAAGDVLGNDDGGEMIATAPMIRVTFPEQAAPSF